MFFRHHFFTLGNDSAMHLIHGTSLLSTPLPLWTSIITLGKKIDDEKTLLLKIIWL